MEIEFDCSESKIYQLHFCMFKSETNSKVTIKQTNVVKGVFDPSH